MGAAFWVRRSLSVFAGAFLIISGVEWLKGHPLPEASGQGALWAAISTTVFIAARHYQARRGRHCAICKDTPEMQDL